MTACFVDAFSSSFAVRQLGVNSTLNGTSGSSADGRGSGGRILGADAAALPSWNIEFFGCRARETEAKSAEYYGDDDDKTRIEYGHGHRL